MAILKTLLTGLIMWSLAASPVLAGNGTMPHVGAPPGNIDAAPYATFGVPAGHDVDAILGEAGITEAEIYEIPPDEALGGFQVATQIPSDPARAAELKQRLEALAASGEIILLQIDDCRKWLPDPPLPPNRPAQNANAGTDGAVLDGVILSGNGPASGVPVVAAPASFNPFDVPAGDMPPYPPGGPMITATGEDGTFQITIPLDGPQGGFVLVAADDCYAILARLNGANAANPGVVMAPPSTVSSTPGAQAVDDDLIEGLRGYFGDEGLQTPFRENKPVPEPGLVADHLSDAAWNSALHTEAEIQENIESKFRALTAEAAVAINAFLAAASAYQERFVLIQSASTGLQGYLIQWEESRGIYEAADLAFALANLVTGIGKLGFKAYRWLQVRKAARVADDAAVAAARVADDVPYAAADQLGADLAKAAQEAGVDVEFYVSYLGRGSESWKKIASLVTRDVLQARGYRQLPWELEVALTEVVQNARAGLGGSDIAAISPTHLATIRRFATQMGDDFVNSVRNAMGELGVAKKDTVIVEEGTISIYNEVSEGFVTLFTEADLRLLNKVFETGGDIGQLRQAVGPLEQAAARALGTGGQAASGAIDLAAGATAAPGRLQQLGEGARQLGEGGLRFTGWSVNGNAVAGPTARAAEGFSPGLGQAPTQVGGTLSDQQTVNILTGQGPLGTVGLSGAVSQFGVTDRFDQGQGFFRAYAGEVWELFTSPSATVASHWYTLNAQGEYIDLLQGYGDELTTMAGDVQDALQGLRALQNAFQTAGFGNELSPLGGGGADDLRDLLDDMRRIYEDASEEWRDANDDEFDERISHIEEKIADLETSMAGFNEIFNKLPLLYNWLDGLYRDPTTGTARSITDLWNPEIFVRLTSLSTFLRSLGSTAFLLDETQPSGGTRTRTPPPLSDEAQAWVDMTPAELGDLVSQTPLDAPQAALVPTGAWDHLSPEQKSAIQEAAQDWNERYWEHIDSLPEPDYSDDAGYDAFLDQLDSTSDD